MCRDATEGVIPNLLLSSFIQLHLHPAGDMVASCASVNVAQACTRSSHPQAEGEALAGLAAAGTYFGGAGVLLHTLRSAAPSKPCPGAGPYFPATLCPTAESSHGPGPPPGRPVLSRGSRNWLASAEMTNVGLDRQAKETNIAYFLLKRAF